MGLCYIKLLVLDCDVTGYSPDCFKRAEYDQTDFPGVSYGRVDVRMLIAKAKKDGWTQIGEKWLCPNCARKE